MKRLVAFLLAMTVTTGAYAQFFDTQVYNFSANVKNTNIKTVRVPMLNITKGAVPTMDVEVKYVQTTTLYGYIIDGGEGWTWAVIANQNVTPRIGHLFYVSPLQIQIFDPTGQAFGPIDALGKSPEEMLRLRFGAEGGLMLNQGEDWDGDNVVYDGEGYVPVNQNNLFGDYDTWGSAWFTAAGFGTARFIISDIPAAVVPMIQFHLSLSGSIIGGWLDDVDDVDAHICGYNLADYLGEEAFIMSSWIAGTWAITPNQKLQPLTATDGETTYGPCYTAAALKAINRAQDLEEAEDYGDYP